MKLKSFTIPILLAMLLIAGCAGATAQQPSPTDVNKIVKDIVTLKFLKDLGVLQSTIDPMEGFTRFILLILLFAVLFRVLDALIGRGTAIAVALVVSLMTVIFIPGTVLLAAASSYGTLFSLILMLVPVGLGVAAYWFLKDHPWIRVVIMGVLAFVLNEMSSYMHSWALSPFPGAPPTSVVTGGYGGVIQSVVDLIDWVFWAVMLLLAWNVLSALFSSVTGHSGKFSGSLKNVAMNLGEKGYKFIKNQAPRTAKAALREHIEEEKELELLRKAEESVKLFEKRYDDILKFKGFEEPVDKTDITTALDGIKDSLHKAETEIRPLLRRTKKAETKFGSLLKELREKKFDTKPLEVLEGQILVDHKTCVDSLNQAIDVFRSPQFEQATKNYIVLADKEFPYQFVVGGAGGFKFVDKKGRDIFVVTLKAFNTAVGSIKTFLSAAITAENAAKEKLERVIAEAEKLLA